MNGFAGRVVGPRCIESPEHAEAFLFVKQRNGLHPLFRILHHGAQHGLEVTDPAFYRGLIEQGAGVAESARYPVAAFLQRQRQVGRFGVVRHILRHQLEPRQGEFSFGCIMQHQHHLEYRAVTETARRLHDIDDLFKGNVLMAMGIQHHGFDLLEQAVHGRVAIELGA